MLRPTVLVWVAGDSTTREEPEQLAALGAPGLWNRRSTDAINGWARPALLLRRLTREEASISGHRDGTGGLLALLAAVAVCCGLPLLLGAGLALSAVGLAVGSGAIIAGAALAVWGWRRRQHAERACVVDNPDERINANAHDR